MSTFDPLGLLAPFLVHGKVIVQYVWKSGVTWDEKISADLLEKWVSWTSRLQTIHQNQIPRKLMQNTFDERNCTHELHIFCDAGGDAYVACAYLRTSSIEKVEVSLITAKTRVNPKMVVSVPRLELLAAVLAVRLLNLVQNSLTSPIRSQTIWSDSNTVLSWLASESRRYKQFVAMRVSECLESTNIKQWRYIPSKLNVADRATKWFNEIELDEWITGPAFLRDDPDTWPKTPVKADPNDGGETLPFVLFISKQKIDPEINILKIKLENISKGHYPKGRIKIAKLDVVAHGQETPPGSIDEGENVKNSTKKKYSPSSFKLC